MKVIITENAEKKLIQQLFKEEIGGLSDKVNLVKSFLDKNFLKATNSVIGDNGRPKNHDIVIMVDAFKQPKQYMSDVDLFYLLQDEFKNILPQDPSEDDDELEDIQDEVNDTFDKAYKKVEKKVSHNNRDKFLKQCIKDWYYNKISKNGNLTMYEEREIWDITSRAYRQQLQDRMAQVNVCRDADDTSMYGSNILKDVKFLVDNFLIKKSKCGKMQYLLNDKMGNYSDTSPDLYYLLQKILSSRAAVKWCYLCPNLVPPQYKTTINDFQTILLNFVNTVGASKPIKSIEERRIYLPFYAERMKRCVLPFKQSDLGKEVMNTQVMTIDLNNKIEEYLNTVFEPIQLNNNEIDISQVNDLDDI